MYKLLAGGVVSTGQGVSIEKGEILLTFRGRSIASSQMRE